jgi:hypothetical protein
MPSTSRFEFYPPGIHGPSVTFFEDSEEQAIDWPTQDKHLEFMISNLHGSTCLEQNHQLYELR